MKKSVMWILLKEEPLKFCRVGSWDRLPSARAPATRNKLPPINSEAVEQYVSVPRMQPSSVSCVHFFTGEELQAI